MVHSKKLNKSLILLVIVLFVLSIFIFVRSFILSESSKYKDNRLKLVGMKIRTVYYKDSLGGMFLLNHKSINSKKIVEFRPVVKYYSDSTIRQGFSYVPLGQDCNEQKVPSFNIDDLLFGGKISPISNASIKYKIDESYETSGSSLIEDDYYIAFNSVSEYIRKYNNFELCGDFEPQREIIMYYNGVDVIDTIIEIQYD